MVSGIEQLHRTADVDLAARQTTMGRRCPGSPGFAGESCRPTTPTGSSISPVAGAGPPSGTTTTARRSPCRVRDPAGRPHGAAPMDGGDRLSHLDRETFAPAVLIWRPAPASEIEAVYRRRRGRDHRCENQPSGSKHSLAAQRGSAASGKGRAGRAHPRWQSRRCRGR